MATILSVIVTRLDKQISRLRVARNKLRRKNLEDKKLEKKIEALTDIRNRLHNKDTQDIPRIKSDVPDTH